MASPNSPVNAEPPFGVAPVQFVLRAIRRNLALFLVGVVVGVLVGLIIFLVTSKVYRAQGTFMIDRLPFRIVQENMSDAETERQLMQSLILSIPGEEMRQAVADRVGVPASDLSFTQRDRSITLSSDQPHSANIEVIATRNSRLGVVSAESPDPQFATAVVNAVFDEINVINQIAGRLMQIQSRLKLNQIESENLVQALATVSAERIKFEDQNNSLDQFLSDKNPPEAFPAFENDATLNNLKTQLILVSSEYDALAAQSTFGGKLTGKKAELDGLRTQIRQHIDGLVAGLRSSFQIARTREGSFKKDLDEVQRRSAALETRSAKLSKAIGDFKLRKELIKQDDPGMDSEASVIVVTHPAYATPRPVRPSLPLDLGFGLLFGLAIGGIMALLRSQR